MVPETKFIVRIQYVDRGELASAIRKLPDSERLQDDVDESSSRDDDSDPYSTVTATVGVTSLGEMLNLIAAAKEAGGVPSVCVRMDSPSVHAFASLYDVGQWQKDRCVASVMHRRGPDTSAVGGHLSAIEAAVKAIREHTLGTGE